MGSYTDSVPIGAVNHVRIERLNTYITASAVGRPVWHQFHHINYQITSAFRDPQHRFVLSPLSRVAKILQSSFLRRSKSHSSSSPFQPYPPWTPFEPNHKNDFHKFSYLSFKEPNVALFDWRYRTLWRTCAGTKEVFHQKDDSVLGLTLSRLDNHMHKTCRHPPYKDTFFIRSSCLLRPL